MTHSLIIGAGVVGLAVARALRSAQVIVVEKYADIGQGTSSRNSEVLHAGLYYPTGSLKHRLCVQGRDMLIEYLDSKQVPYNVCGKLIVHKDVAALRDLQAKAEVNGVPVEILSPAAVRAMEPSLRPGFHALFSPNSGVVVTHQLMLALQCDAESNGALVSLNTDVRGGEVHQSHVTVRTSNGDVDCDRVINCAGLDAPHIAKAFGFSDVPQAWLCRGRYWQCRRKPFSRLVYPLPEKNTAGLGIHATVGLDGRVKFGPNVEWLPKDHKVCVEDYAHDVPAASLGVVDAIQAYWPECTAEELTPDYCGIRPKISGPGAPSADFRVHTHHPRFISLFGIESPGLTASMALAELVVKKVHAS